MRKIISLLLLSNFYWASAQQTILINNVQIFNGKDERLATGNVLISNNLIKKVSSEPISIETTSNT
ncbi:MAG TPA: hypothetical protein VJ765_00720, partial [Chitinophagaceae bacterium]|nr:hypothetical protein [Chitinophagaceae bacterium]